MLRKGWPYCLLFSDSQTQCERHTSHCLLSGSLLPAESSPLKPDAPIWSPEALSNPATPAGGILFPQLVVR